MARKFLKELTDEAILRIARQRVTALAGAFTQATMDTQLSVERGVIWMINFVEFNFHDISQLRSVAADSSEQIRAQVTRESKTSIVNGDNSDLIQRHVSILSRSPAIGTDAGPLWFQADIPARYNFPQPLPYAGQSIFFAITGTDATVNYNVDFRIGYNIVAVSDRFFFRVAQSLVG